VREFPPPMKSSRSKWPDNTYECPHY